VRLPGTATPVPLLSPLASYDLNLRLRVPGRAAADAAVTRALSRAGLAPSPTVERGASLNATQLTSRAWLAAHTPGAAGGWTVPFRTTAVPGVSRVVVGAEPVGADGVRVRETIVVIAVGAGNFDQVFEEVPGERCSAVQRARVFFFFINL
jgi:hypothetical protein